MNPMCGVCGGLTTHKRHAGTRFIECLSCGYAQLAELSPRSDYWPEDLAAHEIPNFWIAAKSAYFKSALDLLTGLAPGRRLLDFGGGVGFFAELALRSRWDACSLDISREASAVAADRIGSGRAFQSLGDVEPRSFHVVTLWCVVAHVTQPDVLISQARSLLVDGGILWITTPNYRFQKPYSAIRRRIRRPIDFYAEDHVGHFTLEALAELLRSNGFTTPSQHFVGVTERCIAAGSDARMAVSAKRAYNRVAFAATRARLPNYVSELQISARRSPDAS